MKPYLFSAAGVYLAAVLALPGACDQPFKSTPNPSLSSSSETPETPKTPAFSQLQPDKDYVILIDAYDDIKRLSKLAGFSGEYGHIEAVRNGMIYGCRPPKCSQISLSELEQKFSGHKFELRAVDSTGDPKKAVQWFARNLEGRAYDLLYRNCTDAVVGMYHAAGDRIRPLRPVEVDRTYAANAPLREFMAQQGIAKPERSTVFFPDQFTQVGKLMARGRLSR